MEVFEILTPLVSGFYLIYMVYRLGFIDEDDSVTLEISSQATDSMQHPLIHGSFSEAKSNNKNFSRRLPKSAR